jgi:hypothetical protein
MGVESTGNSPPPSPLTHLAGSGANDSRRNSITGQSSYVGIQRTPEGTCTIMLQISEVAVPEGPPSPRKKNA